MKRFIPASTSLFAALLALSPAWADPPGGKEVMKAHPKAGYHREMDQNKTGARLHWREERREEQREARKEHRGEKTGMAQKEGTFTNSDVTVILNWGAGRSARMQAGDGWGPTNGSTSLPPGLARQIQMRGHLPPGLEKRRLPPALAERLSPVPTGYERVIIGRDILMIETATGTIADIIRNVF